MRTVVAKIGTSSVTDESGVVAEGAVKKIALEVAGLRADDVRVVLVSSGAISAGLPRLGLHEPVVHVLEQIHAALQSRLGYSSSRPCLIHHYDAQAH